MTKAAILSLLLVCGCAQSRNYVFTKSPETAACVAACQQAQNGCASARWWQAPYLLLAPFIVEHRCDEQVNDCYAACPGVAIEGAYVPAPVSNLPHSPPSEGRACETDTNCPGSQVCQGGKCVRAP